MFDCKLEEGANLKKCVNALKELIEQAAWDISEDGIQLQSMDSSHVALVQMNIGSDSFETFRCDQAMQIGLNMTNLHKIFGAFTNGSCSITADGEDADTVQFVFETAKESSTSKKARMKVKEENADDEEESDEEKEKNSDDEEMADEDKKPKPSKKKSAAPVRGPLSKKQTYELRMMDLDVEQLGIPEQEYQATFSMPSAEFTKIIKDLLIIGESVTIDVKKSGVTFSAEGEIGKSQVHLEKGEAIGDSDESFDLQVNDPIELSFATQYLKKFTAAGPLARDVTVALSADVPMVIAYEVEDFGHLKYFLAPKIDDEDDEE
jgi:proliferating cell nuclear antigen